MQTNNQKENEEIPNVEREDTSIRHIRQVADESTNQSPDEALRQFLRGDETQGDPDERDVVGGSDSIDTPQGREEAKPDKEQDS